MHRTSPNPLSVEARRRLNDSRAIYLTRKLERGMKYEFNGALKDAKRQLAKDERGLGYFQLRVNVDLNGDPIVGPSWFRHWLTAEFERRKLEPHFSMSFDYMPRFENSRKSDMYGFFYIERMEVN